MRQDEHILSSCPAAATSHIYSLGQAAIFKGYSYLVGYKKNKSVGFIKPSKSVRGTQSIDLGKEG